VKVLVVLTGNMTELPVLMLFLRISVKVRALWALEVKMIDAWLVLLAINWYGIMFVATIANPGTLE